MNPFKRETGLQVVARQKPENGTKSRVLEFPTPIDQPEIAPEEFHSIPNMIRDAFLCDLREGRSKLLGFSYNEVLSALSAYRRANPGERHQASSGWLVHSTKGFAAER